MVREREVQRVEALRDDQQRVRLARLLFRGVEHRGDPVLVEGSDRLVGDHCVDPQRLRLYEVHDSEQQQHNNINFQNAGMDPQALRRLDRTLRHLRVRQA